MIVLVSAFLYSVVFWGWAIFLLRYPPYITNPKNPIAVSHDGIKGVEPGPHLLVRQVAHLFTNGAGGHRCHGGLGKLTMNISGKYVIAR